MTFNGYKNVPFCPRTMTSAEVAAWTPANKATWMPVSKEELTVLHFAAAKFRVKHTNLVANNFIQLSPYQWGGTLWGPTPASDDILIPFTTSADLVCVNWVIPDAAPNPEPTRRACATISEFWTGILTDGNFFTNAQVTAPILANPAGTSIGNVRALYDPFADIYYVGFGVRFFIERNTTIWPPVSGFEGTPPPPSTRYSRSGGNESYSFDFATGLTSGTTPLCTVTYFGSTITLKCLGTGNSEIEEAFEAVFVDTDPTYYFS